ncbi:hypothetical protein E2320_006891 [Naja naja]|nr:hypothetical protein E2320_006891 [Naja naja]
MHRMSDVQHGVQLCVVEDEMDRVVVELGDGLEGGAVIGVHKGQILDVQDIHNIRSLLLEDRDTGVAAFHDFGHGVEIQDGVAVDHEAVVNGGHDILHRLGPELQSSLDHVQLLLDQVVVRLCDLQHLHQLLPVVDGADLLTQQEVQDLADRVGYGEGQQHEDLGEDDGVGSHGQAVAGAERLRHDLPEDHDAGGGGNDGHQARSYQVIQEDGEGGVDQDVAQQEGAEQVVALAPDGLDPAGIAPLRLAAAVLHDAQLHRIQRHQAQVEPAEHAREHQQRPQEQHLEPQGQQARLLLHHAQEGVLAFQAPPSPLRIAPRAQHVELGALGLAQPLHPHADQGRGGAAAAGVVGVHHQVLALLRAGGVGAAGASSPGGVGARRAHLGEVDRLVGAGAQAQPVEAQHHLGALLHLQHARLRLLLGLPQRPVGALQPHAQHHGAAAVRRGGSAGAEQQQQQQEEQQQRRRHWTQPWPERERRAGGGSGAAAAPEPA